MSNADLRRLWKLGAVACLATAFAGCADVDKLREAQASFNAASTAETEGRLSAYTRVSGAGANVGDLSVQASAGYAKTIVILKGLKDKEIQQLQADKLWGEAQTIEALSYWRLKDYDHATQVASSIQPKDLFPRDAAVVDALPGLIKISQANEDIFMDDPQAPYKDASGRQCLYGGGAPGRKNFGQIDSLLDSAIQDLEQATAKAAPTDPVYTYLMQAQFSAYKNKSDALAYGCRAPNPPPGKRVPTAAELQAAQSKMNKFYCGLRSNTPKTTVDALIEFWTTILGLNIPDASVCSLQ